MHIRLKTITVSFHRCQIFPKPLGGAVFPRGLCSNWRKTAFVLPICAFPLIRKRQTFLIIRLMALL